MYRMSRQMRIDDFIFPFGQLDKQNEWVKLADIVHWDEAEVLYAQQFVNNDPPAHPARIALGALIIKQKLKCIDEWTVCHISENPYRLYFLGLKEYTSKCPFGASTMVEFRKRFPPKTIAALLAASSKEEKRVMTTILVDKTYRNRETIAWCKERSIQLTGAALGRPPKDKKISKQAKKQEYQDICDRNIVEGEFCVGKRSYALNRIMAHLPETSFCVIGIALLCMNLAKRLRFLLLHFWWGWLFVHSFSVQKFWVGC